jgi:hypothetical protein
VLLVDTCELLAPLDSWLREVFLSGLPDDVFTVWASRQRLPPAWYAEQPPGRSIRALELGNLTAANGRGYLAGRGVAEPEQQRALALTRGHPLSLALTADLLLHRPGTSFRGIGGRDLVQGLAERFVRSVPTEPQRRALEAASLVRLTTPLLLAELLATPDAGEEYEWLLGLSFVHSSPPGLFPHDLVRAAVSMDLRGRDPDRYAELHDRARAYYSRELARTAGEEQQRTLWDYVYLHRDNPGLKPFLFWGDGSVAPELATQADVPALLEMVRRHEGDESAKLAAYWLRRQPLGMHTFRGLSREPLGFLAIIHLHEVTEEDRAVDPAVRAATDYLRRAAPLAPGECATHFRFWLVGDSYQELSPTQSLIFLKIAQHYICTPNLAFTFFPCADSEFWAPLCGYIDLTPIPDANFQVGARKFCVYGHDWRQRPTLDWLSLLADREVGALAATQSRPALDAAGITAAVLDALRYFHDPLHLRASPLLRSRLVRERAGADASDSARVAALRAVLRQASDSLRSSPGDAQSYDALDHAYFHPAPSEENAARLLFVPFASFRRQLTAGVRHVAETLWTAEQTPPTPPAPPVATSE